MNHDTEEEKRKRREKLLESLYLRPQDSVTEKFHAHFCRVCGEEHECLLDECDLAPQTICHNCYYKLEEGEI
jgi:hypothetical protein